MLCIECKHCPHKTWGRGWTLVRKVQAHHGYHSLAGECTKSVQECCGLDVVHELEK